VNLAPAPTPEGTVDLLPDTVGGVTRVVSEDDEGQNGEAAGAEAAVAEAAGAEAPAADDASEDGE
jgi:hypothetical protein